MSAITGFVVCDNAGEQPLASTNTNLRNTLAFKAEALLS
jgi:hypothetical protein